MTEKLIKFWKKEIVNVVNDLKMLEGHTIIRVKPIYPPEDRRGVFQYCPLIGFVIEENAERERIVAFNIERSFHHVWNSDII